MVCGTPPAVILVVECRDPAGYPVLDLIGHELAQQLARAEQQAAEITRRVLAKWLTVLAASSRSLLSREEQMGLSVNCGFCICGLDPLLAWKKQSRGGVVLLAPGTISNGWKISGSEIDWLDSRADLSHQRHRPVLPPENGDLHFFGIRLRDEAGATASCPS